MTEKLTKRQKHLNRVKERSFSMSDNVFLTADPHFFHRNILGYSNRPFKTVEEMNRALVKNWNEKVPEDSDVYICGDLSMLGNETHTKLEPVLRKLNGRKHLILGNHDRISHTNYINDGIWAVHYPYLQLSNGWYLFHDPSLAICCPDNSVIISGHVHNLYGKVNKCSGNRIVFDVGVDAWNYCPVSSKEIEEYIDKV